jgi:AbiV family abortive infection protein
VKPKEAKAIAWRGALTPRVAAEGINAAYRNSRRLVNDAEKLFLISSFPTAMTVAILAIEEYGKAAIIHRILLAKTDRARQVHWREYTSHTAKNTPWVMPNLIKTGAKTVDDFRVLFDEASIHRFVLDDFKQWGIYTECRGVEWSEPEKTITGEMCGEVLSYAKALLSTARVYTEEQMRCYVKHLSPVWTERAEDADTTAIREAMKNYAIECQQRGWMSLGVNPENFFTPKTVSVREERGHASGVAERS